MLESPGLGERLIWRQGGREGARPLELGQEITRHFLVIGVEPDFHPFITGDGHDAACFHGIAVGIQGLEVDFDSLVRAMNVVAGHGIDVVPLAGDPHGVAGDDLASGGIGDPGLDPVLHILLRAGRSVETKRGRTGFIRADRLLLDDLSGTPVLIGIRGLIAPGKIAGRGPPLIKRGLIHDYFHVGVGDRSAEVVVCLDGDLHGFTETEGFLRAVLFRGGDGNLEFRELVFLKSEQGLGSHGFRARIIRMQDDAIFSQGLGVVEFDLSPDAAEGVEGEGARFHFAAPRVADGVFHRLPDGGGIALRGAQTNQSLPLNGLPRSISGPIGEDIRSPFPLGPWVCIHSGQGKGLTPADLGRDEVRVPMIAGDAIETFGIKHAHAVCVGEGLGGGCDPAVFSVGGPRDANQSFGKGRAVHRIADIRQYLIAGSLDDDGSVGHEYQFPGPALASGRFDDIGAGGQPDFVLLNRLARHVITLVRGLVNPGIHPLGNGEINCVNPVRAIAIVGATEPDITREIDLVEGKVDTLQVSPIQVILYFRAG